MLSMIVALSVFADEAVGLIAGDDYVGAAPLVPLLGLSIMLSNLYVFAPGLWLKKQTRVIAVINITVAVFCAALNMILIPRMGLLGAAAAGILGSAAHFGFLLVRGQKFFRVPYDWRRLVGAAAAVASVIVLGRGDGHGCATCEIPVFKIILAVAGAGVVCACLLKPGELRAEGLRQ
jgi:O-antigen/teichoic acid export membrane protein